MAYNEELADLIRVNLKTDKPIEEKRMMGGLVFMVDDKMCVGVAGEDLMVRADKEKSDELLERDNVRIMDMTGKRMPGFLLVDEHGWRDAEQLTFWLDEALRYNPIAKSSKKR